MFSHETWWIWWIFPGCYVVHQRMSGSHPQRHPPKLQDLQVFTVHRCTDIGEKARLLRSDRAKLRDLWKFGGWWSTDFRRSPSRCFFNGNPLTIRKKTSYQQNLRFRWFRNGWSGDICDMGGFWRSRTKFMHGFSHKIPAKGFDNSQICWVCGRVKYGKHGVPPCIANFSFWWEDFDNLDMYAHQGFICLYNSLHHRQTLTMNIKIRAGWWFGTFFSFSIYWEWSSQLTFIYIFETTNQRGSKPHGCMNITSIATSRLIWKNVTLKHCWS